MTAAPAGTLPDDHAPTAADAPGPRPPRHLRDARRGGDRRLGLLRPPGRRPQGALHLARQPPQDPHRDRGAQGARARRLAPAAAAAAAVAVARAGAVGRDAAAVASAPRGGGGRGVQHLHGRKRRGAHRRVRPHDVLVVRVGLVCAHAGRPADGVPHLPRPVRGLRAAEARGARRPCRPCRPWSRPSNPRRRASTSGLSHPR